MPDTELGKANIPIRATTDRLDGDLAGARGKVESAIAGIVGNVQKIGGVALGLGGAGLTAIAGIGAAVGKLAMDAAPVEGLESAFSGLADSAGIGMDDMLAALKKGSAGMVANRDLMESFNSAASLVSLDFATQLPDAMQYLGKVSASTGADMGFLLDSLVKGVGRVSPMILDNLGIQVAQAEATERASEMFGLQAEELSKTQVQAGMMNVVLEKLAANTAAMPDVSENASAKMAQLKATFQDTKDQVGLAFLPALTTLEALLGDLAAQVLPYLTQALDVVAPIVQSVADAISFLVTAVLNGEDPIAALTIALYKIFPPEVAQPIVDAIDAIVAGIQQVIEVATPYVEAAMEWISQNVELKDVLLALGIALAAVILPAIWSVIAAVAPVIAVFVGLVAVIALLRQAWETDFGGIRTALTTFWEDTAKPALEDLQAWLAEKVPAAIETLKAFWEETLLPAIEAVWAFIQDPLMPLFEALGEVIGATLVKAGEALAGLWENVLLPAILTAGEWMRDTLGPILDKFVEWLNKVTGGAEGVRDAIKSVTDWLGDLAGTIGEMKLPDWLTPGSPTPFEIGLRGIGSAMEDLARIRVPELSTALGGSVNNSRSVSLNLYGDRIDERSVFGAYETVRALEGA